MTIIIQFPNCFQWEEYLPEDNLASNFPEEKLLKLAYKWLRVNKENTGRLFEPPRNVFYW